MFEVKAFLSTVEVKNIKYNMPNIFTNRTIVEVYMGQHMRFWYLLHWGVTKAQASLHSCLHAQSTNVEK